MGYLHDNVGKRVASLHPSHSLISRRHIPAWITENIAFLIEFAPLRLTRNEQSPPLPFLDSFLRGGKMMAARESRGSDFNDDLVARLVARFKDQREKDFDVFPREWTLGRIY